jgi:alpha-amylase/alpha-mannosidase (GH57 family)
MPADDAGRFVCIHGHFYQPPRENPWLDAIEIQDSAAPFHDWNERISAECYAPNAVARLLDDDGLIVAMRNNYEHISFNFGPTLLSWMEAARPDVYAAVQAADRSSVQAYGRGNALAQVYGHCIMPLASRRDRITQVRWGIADFMHRFGRRPDGMWLPETAADVESLRVLAEHGIRFTILAPGQAARVRFAGGSWHAASDNLDTSRPYRCDLGNGRSISLFFYDGGIAHAVAFAGLLNDGRDFASHLTTAALERTGPALLHIATDGESYGHHHPHGEMALAAAIDTIEREAQVQLINYAAYLDRFPPRDDVEIQPVSSWSCAHGVERWRADCGCNAGHAGWQQGWRGPLRDSLSWLSGELDLCFERQAVALLDDPWAARDAYIDVILQRDADSREHFLRRQSRHDLSPQQRSAVWKLLEMQRYGLLSFTSCGWFFDEPSGIETVQILAYAARATQLAAELGVPLEDELLRRLAPMRSNLPQYGDGAQLYRALVQPQVSDNRRIVAHYAMNGLLQPPAENGRSYVYRISSLQRTVESAGTATLAMGRVHLLAEVTEDSDDYAYVALHLGGHDMQCAVIGGGVDDFTKRCDELLTTFRSAPLTELVRRIDIAFGGTVFTLRDVFTAERRRILDRVTTQALAECSVGYERIVAQNRRLIEFLAHGGGPIPEELRVAATFVLQRRFQQALIALVSGSGTLQEGLAIAGDAQRWGLTLEAATPARLVEMALNEAAQQVRAAPSPAVIEHAHALLDAAEALALPLNTWVAQNHYYALVDGAVVTTPAGVAGELRRLGERLHFRLRAWVTSDSRPA